MRKLLTILIVVIVYAVIAFWSIKANAETCPAVDPCPHATFFVEKDGILAKMELCKTDLGIIQSLYLIEVGKEDRLMGTIIYPKESKEVFRLP